MNAIWYVVRALLQRGPGFIFLYAKESLAFDLAHGTNTHLRVPKQDRSDASKEYRDGVLYVASLTSVVRQTLALTEKILGRARFRQAQFFDLGCGKGKALLVYAMQYGYVAEQGAVGIEYDPSLSDTARKNIDIFKPARNKVSVVCGSALEVERHIRADTLIVYLYNPFQGDTLKGVLTRLSRYPHVLIYVDPAEQGTLAEFGYNIERFQQGKHHANTWLVATNPALREQSGVRQ